MKWGEKGRVEARRFRRVGKDELGQERKGSIGETKRKRRNFAAGFVRELRVE